MNYVVGTWTPESAVLPDIDIDCTFAQFYITESGKIDGLNIDFKVGNWLVYIKENGKDNWFQANGTVAVNTVNNNFYPKPGQYTKIQLDNMGNIIDTHELEPHDLPSHTHNVDEIEGFNDSIVKTVVNHITSDVDCPVKFRWQKETNSIGVSLNVDETTIKVNQFGQLTINSDVLPGGTCSNPDIDIDNIKIDVTQVEGLDSYVTAKINDSNIIGGKNLSDLVDEQTIIVNQYGQLTAISSSIVPHTHTLNEISDFPTEFLQFASEQSFKNIDFSNGKWDLSTVTIGGAIKEFNEELVSIEENLDYLNRLAGKVLPQQPYYIDCTKLDYKVLDSIKVVDFNTNEKVDAGEGFSVTSEMIYPMKGTLSLYANGIKLSSWNIDEVYSDITWKYKGDFYEFDKNYQEFYEGFKFSYSNKTLEEDSYTVYFIHEFEDKVIKSSEFSFNVYRTPESDYVPFVDIMQNVNNTDVISGVPCYNKNQDFIFKPKVSNYKASKFYPVDFVRFNDRPLSVIGATENIITFEEITITLETPNEYISTSFDVYGFDGTKKMTKTVESNHVLYNNSTVEKEYRVFPTDSSLTRIPSKNINYLGFIDYDSSKELYQGEHECYIINDVAYSEFRDFTITNGPIYNSDSGESIDGRYYHWIELKMKCPTNIKSLSMKFQNNKGHYFTTDKYGVMNDVKVYFGFSDKETLLPSKYVDGQKYYIPWTFYESREFPGLDLSRSDDYTKVYTLGSTDFQTKDTDLYICLAIARNLDLSVLIDSIKKSFIDNAY